LAAQQRVPSPDAAAQIKALANAYANNGGRPVAFVDETTMPEAMLKAFEPDHPAYVIPFYAATAFVVPAEDLQNIRHDLLEIVGAPYWHSTKANQTEEGREKLEELAAYIAEGTEPLIISSQTPVEADDVGSEKARAACLTTLASSLHDGRHCDPVRLFVIERRQDLKRRNRDRYTFTQARKSGLLSEGTETLQVSPTHERLLWVPDIVSYAYYRKVGAGQPGLYRHVENMVTHLAAKEAVVLEAEKLVGTVAAEPAVTPEADTTDLPVK
jgi:hypothetical protein